ncbi:hypothetical protein BGZ76_007618, partial [Entomortierella beljakovae]
WNEEAKIAEVPYQPSLLDMCNWIMSREPGCLVTRLISPVGLPVERKGPRGYKDCTITMSLQNMRKHIKCLRSNSFTPKSHNKRGYALSGSIRTDGFRLQLIGYKLKELNSVRYKRIPEEKLPSPIVSTVGGTDYYLTEIRNLVKTKDDVKALWNCPPEEIKILGVDLGQAFVVGASALLPKTSDRKKLSKSTVQTGKNSSLGNVSSAVTPIHPVSPVFYNLAVKQKA